MFKKLFVNLVLTIPLISVSLGAQADVVKKSKSGICHDSYSSYYNRTKNFTSFDTLQACLNSGGRLPKNYSGPGVKEAVSQATDEAELERRAYSKLYNRDDWPHWSDHDLDCQNTRAEILIERSERPVTFTNDKKCTVKTGLWVGQFTGKMYTQASDVDIDHVVALKWAHGHGGQDWPLRQKEMFANDPNNLIIVDDGLNSQKGAKGPDEWVPDDLAYRCKYLKKFTSIITQYQLAYVEPERAKVAELRLECSLK
ncbi:HNH endonuclease family protein [Salinivibrio sp. YCSC6]|uniref:HNH endonuclease family protein n=1 Tax=Salinivibrio sp. YCSC6 TaxID=2003370 RepID=UPI000BBCEEF2|nr:HNH endonuclease family protein [Salinivibrio sp. YCSC6]PCE67547.1 hypothetical protein B6G00_04155 [Salinivibrio sp. YCSC6]QCF35546.1 HNH endonuclease [Salinivibrio sp. YCSC6]